MIKTIFDIGMVTIVTAGMLFMFYSAFRLLFFKTDTKIKDHVTGDYWNNKVLGLMGLVFSAVVLYQCLGSWILIFHGQSPFK